MLEVKVKKKIDCTIVTHKIDKHEQISPMEMDIIEKGEIPGLMSPSFEKTFTGKRILKFTVANKIVLSDYLVSGISFGDFADVIEDATRIIRGCREHGIRVSNIETRPIFMFYNFKDHELSMLYWPLIKMMEYADEKNLFLELTRRYQAKQEDEQFKDYFDSYLKDRKKFDLYHCAKTLATLKKRWKEQSDDSSADMMPAMNTVEEHEISSNIYDATVSLVSPILIHVTGGKKIELKKNEFRIGRSMNCDLIIEGDSSVSKTHVKLIRNGNKVQIVDLASTNGTFVNGTQIPVMQEILLESDSSIQIGAQEFIFEAPGSTN